MRVLTKSSHDDYDLGAIYELEGEKLERLLTAGLVVPADEWTYRYQPPASRTEDVKHVFTRVAPDPVEEVAPAPVKQDPPTAAATIAPDPTIAAPEPLLTRAEGSADA
jgi:hypothetical protein